MGIFDIFKLSAIKAENVAMKNRIKELGVEDIEHAKTMLQSIEIRSINIDSQIRKKTDELNNLTIEEEKKQKQIYASVRKLTKIKSTYDRIDYVLNQYSQTPDIVMINGIDAEEKEFIEWLSPSVLLKLHCLDVKDLRKAYRSNEKQIDQLLEQYMSRYTTKGNKAIYQLMVIALRSELQNVIFNLKYEKLDKSIDDIKIITNKYLQIASEGNQTIASTLTKFIGEVEYLFINSLKIEYNYYVKKEQARQEQLAIREQMKQEAAERKALEAERNKIEKEEEKFNTEIAKVNELLASASNEIEIAKLNLRIAELQSQLSDVIIKKDEIASLQNGKAGTVYIISNLGSFGDNIFKVGMTRRLDPQDRVNELGDASVPFRFDVHSFIFSEDAVTLESKIHELLHHNRLNKVNLRKEFFKVGLDELEQLVNDIEPTAEFCRTMIAEEFRQSLSSDEDYTSDFEADISEDD